jgi:WD40 repeat protein
LVFSLVFSRRLEMNKTVVLCAITIILFLGISADGTLPLGVISSACADETGMGFCSTSVRALEPEGGLVHSLAFSPDGKLLATGTEDGSIKLWDVKSAGVVRALKSQSGPVLALCFSSDGKYLASGGAEGTVKVWELPAGKCIHTFPDKGSTLEGDKGGVQSLAFSPDGKLLASSSEDKTVRIWDLEKGECGYIIEEHDAPVRSLAFLPDGNHLATAGEDMTVMVWKTKSWPIVTRLKHLQRHKAPVNYLMPSPDAKGVVSASTDGKMMLWDLRYVSPRKTLDLTARVTSVALSPDGKVIAAAASSKDIPVWDGETGGGIRMLKGHQDEVTLVAFAPSTKGAPGFLSPSEGLLASASRDGKVKLWEVMWRQKSTVLTHQKQHAYTDVAFSPDGKFLASIIGREVVEVWEMETGNVSRRLDFSERARTHTYVNALCWSPDGKTLAVGGQEATQVRDPEKLREGMHVEDRKAVIVLWDGQKSSHLTVRRPMDVTSLSFSGDGSLLAGAYSDGSVRIWEGRTCIRTFHSDIAYLQGVSFSPDGRFVAAVGTNLESHVRHLPPVTVWDVETGEGPLLLRGLWIPSHGVSFSPDGRMLVAGDIKYNIIFWDTATWQPLKMVKSALLRRTVFSPDGRLLAGLSGSPPRCVKLFDMVKGKWIEKLQGRLDPRHLSFSPDGTLAASVNTPRKPRGGLPAHYESCLALWWLPGCLDEWPVGGPDEEAVRQEKTPARREDKLPARPESSH